MAGLPHVLSGLQFVDLIPGSSFRILQLLQLYLIKILTTIDWPAK